MKKLIVLLLAIPLLILSSCSKEDEIVIEPTTSLEITFKDKLGNNVQNVVVRLFSSQNDWSNETNQVGATKATNAEGKVTFDNLSNIKYYWLAEKGCINNIFGSVTTASPLVKTKKTTVSTILEVTGTIQLKSTSSNPYRIYINGDVLTDMNGGESSIYIFVEGSYSVRVLQLSGFVLFPTDKTYNVTISCGQTAIVTFP